MPGHIVGGENTVEGEGDPAPQEEEAWQVERPGQVVQEPEAKARGLCHGAQVHPVPARV